MLRSFEEPKTLAADEGLQGGEGDTGAEQSFPVPLR